MSRRPNELLESYFAGLFDGEGCVGVYKCKRNKYTRYDLKVYVKMTNLTPIRLLRSFYGGSITIPKITGNRKKTFCWQASNLLAARFLKSILRFLRVKDSLAALALNFQTNLISDSNRMKNISEDGILAREKIVSMFRTLNKRGIR